MRHIMRLNLTKLTVLALGALLSQTSYSLEWTVGQLSFDIVPLNFSIHKLSARLECRTPEAQVESAEIDVTFSVEEIPQITEARVNRYRVVMKPRRFVSSRGTSAFKSCSYRLQLHSNTDAQISIDLAGSSHFSMSQNEIESLISNPKLATEIQANHSTLILKQANGVLTLLSNLSKLNR